MENAEAAFGYQEAGGLLSRAHSDVFVSGDSERVILVGNGAPNRQLLITGISGDHSIGFAASACETLLCLGARSVPCVCRYIPMHFLALLGLFLIRFDQFFGMGYISILYLQSKFTHTYPQFLLNNDFNKMLRK